MKRSEVVLALVISFGISVFGFWKWTRPRDYAMATSEELVSGPECQCYSKKADKFYNFCYPDPQNPGSYGMKFNCSFVETLEYLDLLEDNHTIPFSDSIKNESSVTFVSAASEDHFNYSMISYNAVRSFYPNHKYVLFGLNLSSEFTKNLPWEDPHFEFRTFNLSPYPEYVKKFKKYHFKGLVMAEAIRDYPVVWWIDANGEMIKPGVIRKWFKEVSENRMSKKFSQLTSFVGAGHTNWAVMHQDLLRYFPSNSMKVLRTEYQYSSGNLFVPRTAYNKKIVKWWALCSLTDGCINPPTAQLKCTFRKDNFHGSANCYRYDQSVLNILLINDFQDSSRFYGDTLDRSFRRIL